MPQTHKQTRPFVCLSIVSVGDEAQCFIEIEVEK